MLDLMKKGILIGIGVASLTKDRVEELVEKIAEESKLSEEEGRKLVKELLEKSEEARKEFQDQVEKSMQKALKTMNIPSREELQDLKARIEKLEGQTSVEE
ncbi:phasin family protein [Dehalococcoidia bacterium]|nr:phasin family protein [Dehalococcoidia bacterium]MCL0038635.1 phasin family protein [Dehalococcoidia bacterium]MCL0048064.1 phasin family protein [Dehalococcoidia bacterium]MCL0050381.1 phasin family protein [Dehalococcoidia bacterium]MCL0056137.1 phasin family protein [Dehalococcoidia bacterium]